MPSANKVFLFFVISLSIIEDFPGLSLHYAVQAKSEADSHAYTTTVRSLIKEVEIILDRVQEKRSDRGDKNGAETMKNFSQTWIKSWTGVPSLVADYVKNWLRSDKDYNKKFKEMKNSAEALAESLADIFSVPKNERVNKAKSMSKMMFLQVEQIFSLSNEAFPSGYIHQCLKQLKKVFKSEKLFEDFSTLDMEEANALMHLLGRPFSHFSGVSSKQNIKEEL